MNAMLKELKTSVLATVVLAVVLCGIYPLLVWGFGQVLFPSQANGSLIRGKDGVLYGSSLLGQNFTGPSYFHPRPSAAGTDGYDGTSSGGSNLGPTSRKLADLLKRRVQDYRADNGLGPEIPIPADAVTASASGLDPHISIRNALLQLPRVSRARGRTEQDLRQIVERCTDPAGLGLLGEAGVNVLELNLALDGKW